MRDYLNKWQGKMPYVFMGTVLLVTWLMLIELGAKQGGWPHWDKVQHIAVFAMLTTLGFIAYAENKLGIAVGLSVYGALIEWLQSVFTVTRMASFGDWIADLMGVLLVSICVFAYQYKRSQKNLTVK